LTDGYRFNYSGARKGEGYKEREGVPSAKETRSDSLIATRYFSNENSRPSLALNHIGVGNLALRGIFFVAHFFRQSAFHHSVGFTPDVFIPGSILTVRSGDLVRGTFRNIFCPKLHTLVIGQNYAEGYGEGCFS
jgi:hypothetical protein